MCCTFKLRPSSLFHPVHSFQRSVSLDQNGQSQSVSTKAMQLEGSQVRAFAPVPAQRCTQQSRGRGILRVPHCPERLLRPSSPLPSPSRSRDKISESSRPIAPNQSSQTRHNGSKSHPRACPHRDLSDAPQVRLRPFLPPPSLCACVGEAGEFETPPLGVGDCYEFRWSWWGRRVGVSAWTGEAV